MGASSTDKLQQQAYSLLRQGRLNDAEPLFIQLCKENDANTEAHFSLCKIYFSQGNLHKAIAQAQRVVELDNEYGEAWLALSSFYADTGRLKEAEHSSRTAIALLPDVVEAKINLVNVLISQEKQDEATALCKHIKADNPKNPGIWHSLGLAFKAQGLIEDAEQCLTRTVELDPDNAVALCTLGEIKAAQEDLSQAQLLFKKSKELNPTYPLVHFELGKVILPGNSEKHWNLIQQLQQDYLYLDLNEAKNTAIELAKDFRFGDATAERELLRFFDEYDPACLYPMQWWTDALKRFGDQRHAPDTALRSIYSAVFSWSLPCKLALEEIASFVDNRLASYGSGTGYWEYLLAKNYGIDVICHDMLLGHRFTSMTQKQHSEVKVDPQDTIFLAWLPGESTINSAIESLLNQTKTGQKLVLVGEPADANGYPGTCGTFQFFHYLRNYFKTQSLIPLANYAYFNDRVELLVRK